MVKRQDRGVQSAREIVKCIIVDRKERVTLNIQGRS